MHPVKYIGGHKELKTWLDTRYCSDLGCPTRESKLRCAHVPAQEWMDGDLVEANYKGRGEWYKATVKESFRQGQRYYSVVFPPAFTLAHKRSDIRTLKYLCRKCRHRVTTTNRENKWKGYSWITNLLPELRKAGFTLIRPFGSGNNKTTFLVKKDGDDRPRYVAKFQSGVSLEREVRFAAKLRQSVKNPNKLIIPSVFFIKKYGYSNSCLGKCIEAKMNDRYDYGHHTRCCEIQPLAIQPKTVRRNGLNVREIKPGQINRMPHLCIEVSTRKASEPCMKCRFCTGTVKRWDEVPLALMKFSQGRIVVEKDAHDERQLGIWCGNPVHMDIGQCMGALGAEIPSKPSIVHGLNSLKQNRQFVLAELTRKPEDGKVNKELAEMVAYEWGVPRGWVEKVTHLTSAIDPPSYTLAWEDPKA